MVQKIFFCIFLAFYLHNSKKSSTFALDFVNCSIVYIYILIVYLAALFDKKAKMLVRGTRAAKAEVKAICKLRICKFVNCEQVHHISVACRETQLCAFSGYAHRIASAAHNPSAHRRGFHHLLGSRTPFPSRSVLPK